VVGAAEKLDAAMAALRGARDGQLVLVASLTVAEYLLPRWLAQLWIELGPGAAVNLVVRNTEQVAAAVLAGEAALGFIEGPDLLHLSCPPPPRSGTPCSRAPARRSCPASPSATTSHPDGSSGFASPAAWTCDVSSAASGPGLSSGDIDDHSDGPEGPVLAPATHGFSNHRPR
jgi:DNA-binding transcriptional LysR family regulator